MSTKIMDVIACPIKNPNNKKLHWDFLRETCKSFNAELKDSSTIILPEPEKNIICLRHDKGIALHDFDLTQINTIIVGCDDDKNDDWMASYQAVRIVTPNNHFLWSGVALGIALYSAHHNMHNQT